MVVEACPEGGGYWRVGSGCGRGTLTGEPLSSFLVSPRSYQDILELCHFFDDIMNRK